MEKVLYYSGIQRQELPCHEKTYILLSERSQLGNTTKYSVIPTVWHSGIGKNYGGQYKDEWLSGVKGVGRMNRQSTGF